MSLCLGCGFCCDGTLFGSTRVAPDERTRLKRLGFTVTTRVGGEVGFMQPCVALERRPGPGGDEHACRCYTARPETCRLYRCKLLVALDDGELGLDEALGEVQAMRATLARLGALLPVDGDEGVRSIAGRGRALAASAALGGELADVQREVEARLDRSFRRQGR